jgi:DUF1680 family protein
VYVNLYIPSSARWKQSGAEIALTQKTEYPYESHVQFEVKTSRPAEFAVNLRIPAWAEAASVAVNGKTQTAEAGAFAGLQRQWSNGDRIDLELPMAPRLEVFDPQHVDTVALLVGPLVLFAITGSEPAATRAQLLAAKRTGKQSWEIESSRGRLKMLPFTSIQDEGYSTYLRMA